MEVDCPVVDEEWVVENEESEHYPQMEVQEVDGPVGPVEEVDSEGYFQKAGQASILAHDPPVAQQSHIWKRKRFHSCLCAGHDTDNEHTHVPAATQFHPECTNPTHRWRSLSDLCTWAHLAYLTFASTV